MGAKESRSQCIHSLASPEVKITKDSLLDAVTKNRTEASKPGRLCLYTNSKQKAQISRHSPCKQDKAPESSPLNIRRQQLQELQEARPQLSDRQMELIIVTWKVLQQHTAELGSDIFIRLFDKYPELKDAFAPFRSIRPEDAHYKQVLQDHGIRVLGTLQMVIDNKDNPEHVIRQLNELGQKHVTFNAKVEYMDIVSQMFMFTIEPVLTDQWSPEVEHAWAQLFRYIVHIMKEAMIL